MKLKLRAVFLFLILIFLFAACDDGEPDNVDPPSDNPTADEELFVPSADDVADGIAFSDIIYSRPDVSQLIALIDSLTEKISSGTSVHSLLPEAFSLQSIYEIYHTMRSYAAIMNSIDSKNVFYSAETEYFQSVSEHVESKYATLISAAAHSGDPERFAECFGQSTMLKYADYAYISADAKQLLSAEKELIEEYNALSLRDDLTEEQIKEETVRIFILLLEVRSTLANELGYASYVDYAYAITHSDYSSDSVNRMYDYIARYIVPVYNKLASRVLNSNSRHPVDAHARNRMLNHLGKVLSEMDGDVGDVYSYMIYHGLFNIEPPKNGRIDATVTSYLPSYRSPFLYVTLEESLTDYMTVCREFGRFYDYLATDGKKSSEELREASSLAMELLSLVELQGTLTSKEYKYLSCMEYESIILTIINNSLYSSFEHAVYSLPYHEINEDTLSAAAEQALLSLGISKSDYQSPADLISSDLIVSPFSVQSLVTSSIVALEIFFEEKATDGNGLALYKLMIHHSGELSLMTYVERVGLKSPLAEETVKYIADSLHYVVLGSHYFEDGGAGDTASADLLGRDFA